MSSSLKTPFVVLLAAGFLLLVLPPPTLARAFACPGDFNGDGAREVRDLVLGVGYLFRRDSRGDLNGDSVSNILDIVYLARNYLGVPCPEPAACANQCGDGACQEIVCLAIGCPCPETVQSCPSDCLFAGAERGCQGDADCSLVNRELGFACCWAGACQRIDYGEEKWVAVNTEWFAGVQASNCPAKRDCGPAPLCAVQIVDSGFGARCVQGVCQKAFVGAGS